MIKCISLVLAILLTGIVQQARADSLVCNHNGQQLIYTEIEKNVSGDGVKTVYQSETISRVVFHNDKEYRYGSIIPCVMIKEDKGNTKFLEEYLAQFE